MPKEPVPTSYDDLKAINDRIAKITHQQAEAMKTIVEIGDKRLAQTQLYLEEEIHSDREVLRVKLEEILAGNIPGRITGAVILALGIISSAAGQLIA